MENKKYLDKVVNHMVKYTKIPSMLLNPLFVPINRHIPIFTDDPVNDINTTHYLLPMYSYLKTQFGLIDDEVKYVFKQYIDVIIDMYNIRN
jgi:hypothetical protein